MQPPVGVPVHDQLYINLICAMIMAAIDELWRDTNKPYQIRFWLCPNLDGLSPQIHLRCHSAASAHGLIGRLFSENPARILRKQSLMNNMRRSSQTSSQYSRLLKSWALAQIQAKVLTDTCTQQPSEALILTGGCSCGYFLYITPTSGLWHNSLTGC